MAAGGGDADGEMMVTICGLNMSAQQPVMANMLFDCAAEVPAEMVDWDVSKMPGMVRYYYALGAIGILIVATNTSIVIGILRDRKLWRQTHVLQIAGQALTDIFVGVLIIVFHVGTIGNKWQFVGEATGCSWYGFLIVCTCHSTLFSLSWIAYTRKVKLMDNKSVSPRRLGQLYVIGVWGTVLVLLMYYRSMSVSRMVSSGSFCNPIYNFPVLVPTGIFIMSPIIYIVLTYWRIHKMVVKTSTQVANLGNASAGLEAAGSRGLIHSNSNKSNKDKSSGKIKGVLRRRTLGLSSSKRSPQRKATRLVILMSGAILVSWIPLYIYFAMLMYMFATGQRPASIGTSEMLLGLAAGGSSLCSPIIYGVNNRTINQAMLFAFLPLSWKEKYSKIGRSPFRVLMRRLWLKCHGKYKGGLLTTGPEGSNVAVDSAMQSHPGKRVHASNAASSTRASVALTAGQSALQG